MRPACSEHCPGAEGKCPPSRASRGLWFGVCALVVSSIGCDSGRSYEAYVPSPEAARAALDTALQAWQHGHPMSTIVDSGPVPIQPVDNVWVQGRKLRSYEVVAQVHGDSPRCFAVRLWLDHQTEAETVRYYVLGINPLWVFRQDDLDMTSHWGCPPAASGAVASGG